MNASLNLIHEEENYPSSIAVDLTAPSAYSKISALSTIDEKTINTYLNEVKLCAYDYRPIVRIHAYLALKFAAPKDISPILKDALRDEDPKAFKAARELNEYINKSY